MNQVREVMDLGETLGYMDEEVLKRVCKKIDYSQPTRIKNPFWYMGIPRDKIKDFDALSLYHRIRQITGNREENWYSKKIDQIFSGSKRGFTPKTYQVIEAYLQEKGLI